MSSLFLIRHGQASFGAADYDVLSELGIEQSRRLGRHLARTPRLALDAFYTGPLTRQIDTARHVVEAARDEGASLPEAEVLDDLNEYPAFELVAHWGRKLAASDAQLAELLRAPLGSKRFERAFAAIMKRWAAGELEAEGIESFSGFCARVERGLQTIMRAQGRGRRVAAITSGGPISIALRAALALDSEMTMRMAPVVANASITELRYREAEMTLFGFNEVAHLADEAMITYR